MLRFNFSFRIVFLCLLCFENICCIAQIQRHNKTDSLIYLIKSYNPPCNQPCLGDSFKINNLIALESEISRTNPDSSLLIGKEALDLAEKSGWQMGIALSLDQLAMTYQTMGNYPASVEFGNKGLAKWDEIGNGSNALKEIARYNKAIALNNIGVNHDILGKYEEALNDYNEALVLFKKLSNKDKTAQTLVDIAIVFSEQGLYPKSIDYYFQALKIFEESGNKIGIAKTLGNIGIIYEAQSDYKKALDYLFRALKMAEENGIKNAIASDLANIAMVYSSRDDYQNSLQYYARALPVAREDGDRNLEALILNNTGEVYDKQNDFSNARNYYLQSLAIFQELKIQGGIAAVLGNLGSLFVKTNNYKDAEKYMLNSLALYDTLGAFNESMKMHKNLSELYTKTGDYKKALQYYQSYAAIKDSLFDKDKTKEIAQKEFSYEQEKKDVKSKQELENQKLIRNAIATGGCIIILSSIFSFIFYKRRRDAVQKQKETSLNLQVSETEMKALRSQMNPHFIFNALQSIQTFLVSHKSEEANEYLLKFSKLMRLVLENSQYSEVPLKVDMQALELYMQLESIRLPHPFTYHFNIDESVNVENDNIPPLILQPFVENAIWHGLQYKPNPGDINISIAKKDNVLYATVEDNGLGREMSRQITQPFVDKKESLGMKLTEERLKVLNETKKINARFKITDLFTNENKPAGTKVELILPIST